MRWLIGAFVVVAPAALHAGVCGGVPGGKVVVAAHTPYVTPVTQLFFVGAPVRVEALVTRQLQADPEYRELQDFKQFLSEYEQFRAFRAQQTAATPLAAATLQEKCGRCHSGGARQGGFSIDPLDDAGRLSAIHRVTHPDPARRMPPGNPLSERERGEVVREIVEKAESGARKAEL
jgi:mono/diheme cytochrome c family protein